MHFKCLCVCTFFAIGLAIGCGPSVKEETIEVKPQNDPLFMPRAVLTRYADGEPMGSESTSFPHMVETLRESDPKRAAILEEGFRELENASHPARKGLAKRLLAKLEPSMQ